MSNSILQDMANIVWSAAPELRVYGVNGPGKDDPAYDLWSELWAGIKPIKYGSSPTWSEAAEVALARYEIPVDTYHCILRVKTETRNYDAAAIDFYVPAPPPGFAWWELQQLGTTVAQVVTTPGAPAHTMVNCEEFLIFEGGYYATLKLDISIAPPDTNDHVINTLVYGYNITGQLASLIGSNQAAVITG